MTATRPHDRTQAGVQIDGALPAPAEPAQRIELLDALRGFALFGVCLANLFIFGYLDLPAPAGLPRATLPTDGAATFLMHTLVEGRFYSIFSLLFGLGFALQLHRAEARGGDGIALFKRRLRILMLFGLAHLLFFWFGDILLFYALMGLVLMRMRHLSDRQVIKWAVICILLPVVLYLPIMIHQMLSIALPFFAVTFGLAMLYDINLMQMQDAIFPLYTSGNIVDWFKLNTLGMAFRYADLFFTGRPFKVLAMFLVGMYVGRHRVWSNIETYTPVLKRIALWGFGIGLPASIALTQIKDGDKFFAGTFNGLAESALYAAAVFPLALAYAATFALLWRRSAWERLLRAFAPAGKMALTNYLSQTLIATLIFSGFGLRQAGKIGATYLWLLAIAILTVQILLSQWWLRRYRFGPLEWIWRSATYRAKQAMKR